MSYKEFTRTFLSKYAMSLRCERMLSQAQMSELLRISLRSYSDLERGKFCFSSVSLLFLLLMLSPKEANALLAEFQAKIQELEETEIL